MRRNMLITVALILIAAWGYFKFSSVNAAKFHVDPTVAETPSHPGFYRETQAFDMPADTLATNIASIIISTPRTTLLAGDLSKDYASFVTRSAFWGFADIASVKVTPLDDGRSELTIFSRLRHGYSDVGVNEARVKNWLGQLAFGT